MKGWYGKIHESPQVEGEIGELQNYILHYTHRDLGQMLDKTNEWSEVEAELRFKSDHPKMSWWRFPRVMISAFFDSYYKQKGYKAGIAGLIESIYQSFSIFITYAKLWEKQLNEKLRPTIRNTIFNYWPIFFIFTVWFLFASPYFIKGLTPFPSSYQVNFFLHGALIPNLQDRLKTMQCLM